MDNYYLYRNQETNLLEVLAVNKLLALFNISDDRENGSSFSDYIQNNIKAGLVTAFLIWADTTPAHASNKPHYRTINGFYNSNGTIDTEDGNIWKVKRGSFAYSNATPITVKFDTRKTKSKLDDCIVSVKAKDKNIQLVNNYIKRNYDLKAFSVKYIKSKKLTYKMIRSRVGKNIIYVEVCKSVANGNRHGVQDGKYYIAYNKNVRKDKHVTSYCIWNPCNNYCDDVEAVVDNEKIR